MSAGPVTSIGDLPLEAVEVHRCADGDEVVWLTVAGHVFSHYFGPGGAVAFARRLGLPFRTYDTDGELVN